MAEYQCLCAEGFPERCPCNAPAPEVRLLREAIDLMLAEIEGIEVAFENGCKGAAIMVGRDALAGKFPGL